MRGRPPVLEAVPPRSSLTSDQIEAMTDTVENLILDLIEWLNRGERSYRETMDAWRTSCPRLTVWEDANERGFVETLSAGGRATVRATAEGLAFLEERRSGHSCLGAKSLVGARATAENGTKTRDGTNDGGRILE